MKASSHAGSFVNKIEDRSIQTLCYQPRHWALVHPNSSNHPWKPSTVSLEITCAWLNWLVVIRKGHTCLYKLSKLMLFVSVKHESWCRGRIVWRDLGKGSWKCKSKLASIILWWEKFESIISLPKSAKLSNQCRRSLVRQVTKNPVIIVNESLYGRATFWHPWEALWET